MSEAAERCTEGELAAACAKQATMATLADASMKSKVGGYMAHTGQAAAVALPSSTVEGQAWRVG